MFKKPGSQAHDHDGIEFENCIFSDFFVCIYQLLILFLSLSCGSCCCFHFHPYLGAYYAVWFGYDFSIVLKPPTFLIPLWRSTMPTTTIQLGFNSSSPNQSIFFSATRLQKLVPKDVKEAPLKGSCKQCLLNKKLWFHFPNLVLFRSKKYCRHLLLLLTHRPTYNDFNATGMQKTYSILSFPA